MKRRDFIKTAAVASGFPLFNILAPQARSASLNRPMNLVIFITDQERAIQHFPKGWAKQNLPTMQALSDRGLSFTRACCSSSMCSPSRASLFTGTFPAQHQVKDTLTEGTDFSDLEQVLPLNITNLANVMEAAGYDVVYKGKWHLTKPTKDRSGPEGEPDGNLDAEYDLTARDLLPYGFRRWNSPDAGENVEPSQFGGGDAANDRRFVRGFNAEFQGQEGAEDYIARAARSDRPFCMIVSLVNPHDVLAYPTTWSEGGYGPQWIEGTIGLPETLNEDLRTKPTAQRLLLPSLAAGLGALTTPSMQKAYLNFYGNLMRLADRQIGVVYNSLIRHGLLDDTLIVRTSDHGEMGLAHGGLRQKAFNFYEETMRIPLIFSNPRLFPNAAKSDALVSHVDLLPTLASLFKSPKSSAVWEGVDYSHLIVNGGVGPEPQNYVAFTFDDVRAGQNVAAVVPPPNRIQSIRERRYKIARYFDAAGEAADQWEMYDLANDPLETINLGSPQVAKSTEQRAEFRRLQRKLERVVSERLRPLNRTLLPEPVA